MVVAGDHRPPRTDVVDVAVAVDIEQVRPFGALDEERLAADRLERTYRRVYASWYQRLRSFKLFLGTVGILVLSSPSSSASCSFTHFSVFALSFSSSSSFFPPFFFLLLLCPHFFFSFFLLSLL